MLLAAACNLLNDAAGEQKKLGLEPADETSSSSGLHCIIPGRYEREYIENGPI
jgi:hypothetical protein